MSTTLDLDAPLTAKTVDLGAQAPTTLAADGLTSYRDVLGHLPRRYEDRRALPDFGNLVDGETATVSGTVMSRVGNRSRRGLHVFRAGMTDGRGQRLTAVWFNQPWLEKQVFPGVRLILSGR